MKSLLDLSTWPLEWLIPSAMIIIGFYYINRRIAQIKKKHISSRKLDKKTIFNLMFSKNRKVTWEDFQQVKGSFSDDEELTQSYGGGISGSW